MRAAAAIAGLVVTIACVRVVAAEPPPLDHVVTAPTAWLPRSGTVVGWAGIDHRGAGSVDVGLGLGGIAAIDVGGDHDVRECAACGDTNPTPIGLGRAGFRLGAPQDALFSGQPAVVLGWRATFAGAHGARASDAYLVASRTFGGLRLHAGIDAIDARSSDHAGAPRLGATLRPTMGVELTVAQYPRTTLLGDLVWVPRAALPAAGGAPLAPGIEALGGWGVRYQALQWGAIELVVRHRGGEGIGDATVMVRVNGVWER